MNNFYVNHTPSTFSNTIAITTTNFDVIWLTKIYLMSIYCIGSNKWKKKNIFFNPHQSSDIVK